MTRIISIGGLAMDWSETNQTGSYSADLAAPGDQPSFSTIMVERGVEPPVGSAVRMNPRSLTFYVRIWPETGVEALRVDLLRALDTSREAKALIIADGDGSDLRYWMCNFQTREEEDRTRGSMAYYAVTATVVADVYPRSVTPVVVTSSLSSSGQTVLLDNAGDLDAYPTITIAPTSAKTGGKWQYRQFMAIGWRGGAASNWPTMVWSEDTTGLTPDKAIDETSVGLIVDGVEVDRWFGGANGEAGGFDSSSTYLWANLDWQPGLSTEVVGGISSTGTTLTVADDISAWPESGILLLSSGTGGGGGGAGEAVRYRGKDNERRQFLNLSRGEFDTADAWGNIRVTWIQHEIYIVYSPVEDIAKEPDDSRKPLIDMLNSNEGVFIWSGDFGSADDPLRSGQWRPVQEGNTEIFTGDEDDTTADPYEVMGISVGTGAGGTAQVNTYWHTSFPFGITYFSMAGKLDGTSVVVGMVLLSADGGVTWLRHGRVIETNPDWEPVAITPEATITGTTKNSIAFRVASGALAGAGQISSAEVEFDAAHRPIYRAMIEQANYSLDLTITNETTGESIRLECPVGQSLNRPLVIDTEEFTVSRRWTDPWDNVFFTNLYHIMSKNSHRLHMLRLVPGGNLVRFTETGLTGMDVQVTWEQRTYL